MKTIAILASVCAGSLFITSAQAISSLAVLPCQAEFNYAMGFNPQVSGNTISSKLGVLTCNKDVLVKDSQVGNWQIQEFDNNGQPWCCAQVGNAFITWPVNVSRADQILCQVDN